MSAVNKAVGTNPTICVPVNERLVSCVSAVNATGMLSPEKLCHGKLSVSSLVRFASGASEAGAAIALPDSPMSCSVVKDVIVVKMSIGHRPGVGAPSWICVTKPIGLHLIAAA